MALTNADRKAIVIYRIENAHKELKALQVLMENELWNNAMSRLYYACFCVDQLIEPLIISNSSLVMAC